MTFKITIPPWLAPLSCMIVLLFLYPKVRDYDRERKIAVHREDMHDTIQIEQETDGSANETALLETKLNALLETTNGKIHLNRSGNIVYEYLEDDVTYTATFFCESLDYVVSQNSIKGECKSDACVTMTKSDDEDAIVEAQEVFIVLQNAEQGDRFIELIRQFQQVSAKDTKIDTGIKRRFKRLIDKFL